MPAHSDEPVTELRRSSASLVAQAAGNSRSSYRLDVIGHDVADVVCAAGGWLFDRTMGGWDVRVYAADIQDTRPLRILGAATFPLDRVFVSNKQRPQAIAVASGLLASDERVREHVLTVLGRGGVEVTVWGAGCPDTLGAPVKQVQHRMSLAARAFKAHALTAAEIPYGSVERDEFFGSGARRRYAAAPDLVPAG
jgi:hypothetical protein